MIRIIFMFCLLFPFGVLAADAAPETIIRDQKEAALLLGRHVFTDHEVFEKDVFWQNTKPGKFIVTKGDYEVMYTASGFHEVQLSKPCTGQVFSGGMIVLTGVITEVRAFEFDFQGTISGAIGAFDHLQKTGHFTFSRKSHPDYWSLQGIEPLSQEDDYWRNLDIYLTEFPEKLFDFDKALRRIKDQCENPQTQSPR